MAAGPESLTTFPKSARYPLGSETASGSQLDAVANKRLKNVFTFGRERPTKTSCARASAPGLEQWRKVAGPTGHREGGRASRDREQRCSRPGPGGARRLPVPEPYGRSGFGGCPPQVSPHYPDQKETAQERAGPPSPAGLRP